MDNDKVSWLPVSASELENTNDMSKENETAQPKSHAPLSGVVVSTVLKPTMNLRWRLTEEYDPFQDCFIKVLEQKWISDTGYEEWKEIEVVE